MTKAEATAKWRKKHKMLNKHIDYRKNMSPAEKEYLNRSKDLKGAENESTG